MIKNYCIEIIKIKENKYKEIMQKKDIDKK